MNCSFYYIWMFINKHLLFFKKCYKEEMKECFSMKISMKYTEIKLDV